MKHAVSLISNRLNSKILNDYKIQNIEITPASPIDLVCNYKPVSIQSLFYDIYSPTRFFENKKSVESTINLLSRIDNITHLHSDIINCVFGSPSNRSIRNKADIKRAIDFFRKVIAVHKNMYVGIEPNCAIYGTNFLNTLQETIDFVKTIDSCRCGITLDLGSTFYNKEDISKIVNKNNICYINHVHVSSPGLTEISSVPKEYYVNSINHLLTLGYDKYVSLESLALEQEEEIETFLEIINLIH